MKLEALIPRADALLRWPGTQDMGGSDVLAWIRDDGSYALAIRGPAKRLESRLFGGDKLPINNYKSQRDVQLQRGFGLDAEIESGRGWTGIGGGAGQTMSTGRISLDEVVPAIESVLSASLDDEPVHFTVMPLEGEPWEGEPTPYYSAKRGRVRTSSEPKGVVRVETSSDIGFPTETRSGIDFCTVAPRLRETSSGVVATSSGSDKVFLTRSLNIGQYSTPVEELIRSITSCGGMLYPSLALSDVPATNFGTLVLVARIGLALRSISPYREKNWPVDTYSTDAWTDTAREFLGNASVELYEQLTGSWEPRSYGHMQILGPRLVSETSMGHEVRRATSLSQIKTRLAKIRKRWRRGMTAEQIEAASDLTDLRYPYMEVKPAAVVEVPDSFVLAICPKSSLQAAKRLLQGIGFNGELITLPQDPSSDDVERWDYAWRVRDAVLAWQERRDAAQHHDWLEYFWLGHLGSSGEFNRPNLASDPKR